MKEILLKALERMEESANILKKYKLTYLDKIYYTLDTSDLRRELEQLEAKNRKSINEVYQETGIALPYEMQVPDVLSDSQITAECIKVGITNTEEIKWVKIREGGEDNSLDSIQESIRYLLANKQSNNIAYDKSL